MKSVSAGSIILCIGLSLIMVSVSPAGAEPSYTAFDLGTLQGGEGSSWGWGLNDIGQVVGHADAPNGLTIHAFLYENGEMIDLGTLGGTYSWAYGINNSSQITGYSFVNSLIIHGYLWENGVMNDIGQLPQGRGPFSRGNDINENGVIAGICHSSRPGMVVPYTGFIYDHGDWTELPSFGGDDSHAYAINNMEDVVGWAEYAPPDPTAPRAFLYRDGEMIDIGTLGGNLSWAEDINDPGQIVGWSADTSGFYRAFLWQDGVMTDLGDFGGNESWAYAINHRGQIVGSAAMPDGTRHGYLLENGVMWDINDIVQPGLDVVFHGARDINELGQIATSAELPDGSRHAYLLTPELLKLGNPDPGSSGEINSVTVTSAAPGDTVYFVWGLQSGPTSAGECGFNVSIKNPRFFGTAIADSSGAATVSVFVPEIASGRTIFIQAGERPSCVLSNLVRYTFE